MTGSSREQLDMALAAIQRQPLPGMGPQSFQAHFVRYDGSKENTEGCWTAAQSPKAASQGVIPDFVQLEVMQAPAEWAVPTRVDRYIKPAFKVRIQMGYRCSFKLPIKVKACLLTELDCQEIKLWNPAPVMNDVAAVTKMVYTSLKGEVLKSLVISGQCDPTVVTAKDSSSCSSMQDAATRPNYTAHSRSRFAAAGHTMGMYEGVSKNSTTDSHAAAPHSSMMEPSSRTHSPGASDESVDSMAQDKAAILEAGRGVCWMPHPYQQQQVVMQDIVFADLRFAKPSRMHPIYIVFCCQIPFCEDTLFTLFTVPTIVTCRAEQCPAALKRLGQPIDLLAQANNLKGSAAVSSPETDQSSEGTSGSGSGSKEDLVQGSGTTANGDLRALPGQVPQAGGYPGAIGAHQQHQFQPQPARGQPNGNTQGLSPSPTPLLSPTICTPGEGHQQPQPAATITATAAVPHWQGGYGSQAAANGMAPMFIEPHPPQTLAEDNVRHQVQGLMWPHGKGDSSSSSVAAAVVPQLQLPQHQQPGGHVWGRSGSDGASVHNGACMQDVLLPPLPPPPMIPPCGSAVSQPMLGGCPVLNNHELSPAGLAAWLEEEYDSTGLTRRLTHADIQTLVTRSGFMQCPADPLRQQQLLAHFTVHMRSVFSVLKQVSSLWNQTHPVVVVAGFEVGREDAAGALAKQPVGTFVCRMSFSGAGGLALAVKSSPDHPQAGPDGIVHVLITGHDLQMRRADTVVRDLPGASHLLDLYTCRRVDKRKIFATNYTHLKKLEHLADLPYGDPSGTGRPSGNAQSAKWQQQYRGMIQPEQMMMAQSGGDPLAMTGQQKMPQAQEAKRAAQARVDSAEFPLVDVPVLDGRGATVAEEPATCAPALTSTPPPFPAPLGITWPSVVDGTVGTWVPPQRSGPMLPATAPAMYPSLTLDILDHSACMSMLNDANGAGLNINHTLEAPMRGSSMFLDSAPEIKAALEASTPLPMQPLPAQPPPAAPGGQEMPAILNKDEQSFVNMLID